jgi:hypothetical protein
VVETGELPEELALGVAVHTGAVLIVLWPRSSPAVKIVPRGWGLAASDRIVPTMLVRCADQTGATDARRRGMRDLFLPGAAFGGERP